MERGRTQELSIKDSASGMTAVPITEANHAGLKCWVIVFGVTLNCSAKLILLSYFCESVLLISSETIEREQSILVENMKLDITNRLVPMKTR